MPTPHTTAEQLPGDWDHREAVVNGVRLHYVEAGHGPLVVLLHGFPEFWYCWRFQIPALVGAGFRVIAPDLRGYNLSDKPPGVASYRLPLLSQDVAELIRHAGVERAAVAGHDWGGGVAWYLAMTRPECVEKLVILNAPHPALYERETHKLPQLLASWYVFFFQLPWLPELVCRWHRFALLRRALSEGPVRRDAVTRRDIDLYVRAIARPGALTAALNWYRAVFRSRFRGGPLQASVLNMPTLVLWGERDRYLLPALLDGLEQWVKDLRIERFPKASHWVHLDETERVNRAMIDFLRAGDQSTGTSDGAMGG
ncbi:MAG TPA: alpha/beta hydrolase [Gemmataceae bacterium]|nr:alpha/beta hydrolase [Gemmataceae bacterium]